MTKTKSINLEKNIRKDVLINDDLNRQIVLDYIRYYNSFEIENMIDLFSQDCCFENISNSSKPIQCIGKNALYEMACGTSKLFKERKQTVKNWIIGENKIAVEIDYMAVLSGPLPNGLKAGDSINLKGISIYEFENKKIKRLCDFS